MTSLTAKSKPRVLIFSTAYLPHIGGAELAVKEITDRLADISFTMITARLESGLAAHEKLGNIEVYRIGKGDALDKIRLFFNGVKRARSLGAFDVVWAIMASYGGFAVLRYKKKTGTKMLLTLQEGDSKAHIYSRVWFVWPYFKQIFKRADRIQAISNYLATWGRRMGAHCPIDVVPNGVNIENFKFQITDFRLPLRRKFGINNDDKVVVSTSRLVKKNGLSDLIRAMTVLPMNVHLVIVGIGELERDLKVLTDQLNINQRVHFVGFVSHESLPGYLHAADIFCRPSMSEGLGISFFEAMAAGLPVVATEVGGIPDFLKDGATGWFCTVNNPKSIAEKITYILDENNRSEIQRVRLAAQEFVSARFLWDNIAQQMRRIFDQLVHIS